MIVTLQVAGLTVEGIREILHRTNSMYVLRHIIIMALNEISGFAFSFMVRKKINPRYIPLMHLCLFGNQKK